MELAQPLPSDGQLAEAARRGSAPAWAELESRHGWAVHMVARSLRRKGARRSAHEAMDRLRLAIAEGEPIPDGVEAVRALRPRAIAELTGGRYGPADGGDPDRSAEDGAALAATFARLPEPWQTVLWHSVVEERSAGEMTPLLGRGVNDVLALLHTARSGLHQTYLRAIADVDWAGVADECRAVVPLLAAAGRGTLAALEQRGVDAHIMSGRDGGPCRDCRARLDLVATIDERLPAAIVPGISGLSVERYREVIGSGDRSFGAAALRASRSDRVGRLAVAGAAAVILLAVVGAFLLIRRPFEESASSTSGGPSSAGTVATTTGDTVDDTVEPPPTTAETAGPTTTELLLRPPPTGPANTVELVFASGTRAIGAAAPQPDVGVELASTARVFAGGTGTIDVTVTNTAKGPVDANFEVRTPNGLLFDALADGDAECRGAREDAAFCNVALDAGETTTLAVRLRLETSVVGRLIIDPGPVGTPLEVGIAAAPRLVHSSVGRGEVLMIGNTVISCVDSAPACPGARDLTGAVVNRWDVPLAFIGEFPSLGWANSSRAALELPAGAGVEAAYLFWSGDLDERGRQIADDGTRERVSMLAPNSSTPVTVQSNRLLLGDVDATQYLGYADVTDLVASAGPGDYLVGNIRSVEVQGSYAGWSLVVVTADDGAPPRQHVVTSPFAWFAPDSAYRSTLPVPYAAEGAVSLDVLAFEGEPGFRPEHLVVAGTPLGGDNPFDGSIVGPRDPAFANNFGIDVEAYDLSIDASDGALVIDATSEKDGVRIAVIGLAVDLPS